MTRTNRLSILQREGTRWRVERADRFSVIVDAADFFRHAKSAMLQARHSVLLIGWDFDARIAFEPEGETLEGPGTIGKFLNWLGKRRPDVDVRILKWDVGAIHSLGRGETPFFMLNWMLGNRVRLKLDGAHPPLSAHHMKLLVIDDALAFCGGIDMTVGRWDTRAHASTQAGRVSPRGKPLGPWHDATTCVSGPIARALADLAQDRWRRATGESLGPLVSDSAPWPEGLPADFTDVEIGIARTAPAYGGTPQISEIERANLAIIAAARRTLYIESQYFASRTMAEAIAARLREPDGPEIVVINPDTADGWLEAKAMDSARIRMMHLVQDADLHGRFRIVYPVNNSADPIYVHAKIMIADDTVLKIGSANLNNRSMGFDTECDLILEPERDDETNRALVLALRDDLLAEHLGTTREAVSAAIAAAGGSVIGAIDRLDGEAKRLVPVPMRALTVDEEALAESDLADPERPSTFRRTARSLLRRH